MATKGYIALEDYSKEKSGVGFYLQDIGAGNYASVTQDLDELKDAIAAVSGCVVRSAQFTKDFPESFALSTNPDGNREAKWLVRMRDTTPYLGAGSTFPNPGYGQIFTFTIPGALSETADGPTKVPNTDLADLVGNAEMAALVVALEANARSDTNNAAAVTPTQVVIDITWVGRNN